MRVIPLLVRELQALGHKMRLMPPAYVKPSVKRQKNDTTLRRFVSHEANMRFMPTKTAEPQSCLMLHRARHIMLLAIVRQSD